MAYKQALGSPLLPFFNPDFVKQPRNAAHVLLLFWDALEYVWVLSWLIRIRQVCLILAALCGLYLWYPGI